MDENKIQLILKKIDCSGRTDTVAVLKSLNVELDEIEDTVQLLESINSIIESNYLQTVVYSYLQESIFRKLKESLNNEDDDGDERTQGTWTEESEHTLETVICLLNKMIGKVPSNIERVEPLMDRIELILNALQSRRLIEMFETKIADLKNDYMKRKAVFTRKVDGGEVGHILEPGENYRDLPIIPCVEEITSTKGLFLRPVLKYGAYRDVEHYLDVYFRLLREDYVGSLRDGIIEYLALVRRNAKERSKTARSSLMNIRVYTNVAVGSHVYDEQNMVHEIHFNSNDQFKRIRWETSKRLLQGSLVCLTNDNFKSVYFAVVFDRKIEDLKQGKLLVKFDDWISVNKNVDFAKYTSVKNKKKTMNEFTLIESLAYFESYRHVLSVLKLFNEQNFPFKKHIVYSDNAAVEKPKYLKGHDAKYDFSVLTKDKNYSAIVVLDRRVWPACATIGLDQSQYNALFTALTNELVVIQGPPGTGKTYLGLQVIKMLLHNSDYFDTKVTRRRNIVSRCPSPILIVCYTNHALDQLLVLISKFLNGFKDIVRVGSRSKEECLEACSLNNLKRTRRVYGGSAIAKETVKQKIETINRLISQLNFVDQKVLSFNDLEDHFPEGLLNSLLKRGTYSYTESNKVFEHWLGVGKFQSEDTRKENDGVFRGSVDEKAETEENDKAMKNMNLEEAEIINQAREIEDDAENKSNIRNLFSNLEKNKTKQIEGIIADAKDENNNDDEWLIPKRERERRRNQLLQFSKCKPMDDIEANSIRDVWKLNFYERLRFYRYLVDEYRKVIETKFRREQKEYKTAFEEFENERDKESLELINSRRVKVIGMTTTGAAKNQNLLRLLKPKIIIVEEAAEVFESSIVACLTESCEHLILIGDNEQLAPSPNLYKLSKHYHLNVSLFERLVNNKIPKARLNLQHRMRPEISILMKYFYDDLIDHEIVKSYDSIKGVVKNVFFIDHNYSEDGDEDSLSKSNKHEAEYLTRLCNYLLFQNYSESQITILVAYGGQLLALKNQVAEFTKKDKSVHPALEKVKITSIDNYQGEENDIVLLSLVRSNAFNSIGFLAQSNRVCVALSRAKMGFYVIGNFKHLANCSKLWRNILSDLEKEQMIGETLNVCCQIHPGKVTSITNTTDFNNCLNGGCDETCAQRLECGHKCEQTCHVVDHQVFKCVKPCNLVMKECSFDHICKRKCYDECATCEEKVEYKLRCGHSKNLRCKYVKPYESLTYSNKKQEIDEEFKCETTVEKHFEASCGHTIECKCHQLATFKCNTIVSRVKPLCEHEVLMHCSHNLSDIDCKTIVEKILNCGHLRKFECHEITSTKTQLVCREPVIADFDCDHTKTIHCYLKKAGVTKCNEICASVLKCGHECENVCAECDKKHAKCKMKCGRKLECGHLCSLKCGVPCYTCTNPCTHQCPHETCTNKCGEVCQPCSRPCIWSCKHHKCYKKCNDYCQTDVCDKICGNQLPCKHRCQALCGEMCFCSICLKISNKERHILLNNCKCLIPVEELDNHMEEESIRLENSHGFPECPECKHPVYYSRRYSNLIRYQMAKYHRFKKAQFCSNESKTQLMNSVFLSPILQRYIITIKYKAQVDFIQNRIRLYKLIDEVTSQPNNQSIVLRSIPEELRSYSLVKAEKELSQLNIELPNALSEEMAIKLICLHCFYECATSRSDDAKRIKDHICNRFDMNGEFTAEYLNDLQNEIKKTSETSKVKIYNLSDIMKPVVL